MNEDQRFLAIKATLPELWQPRLYKTYSWLMKASAKESW